MEDNNKPIIESDSLETPVDEPAQTGVVSAPTDSENGGSAAKNTDKNDDQAKETIVKRLFNKINIYTILLVVVLLILGGITLFAISQNNKTSKNSTLNTQKLTQDTLNKLASTDSSVGDAKQTLSIESNAIFAGGVVVSGNVDIAGTLKISQPLSLTGLSVGGTSNIDNAAVKSLTDSGDATIQGKVTIQNGISVTGSASFSGTLSANQISANSLLLGSELQLNSHIVSSGSTPNRANGAALGSGGTASNNGSDSSGTVTINTGNSAPAGCFVTLTFAKAYSSIPHVIISPSSATAAGISYYVTRTASNFSICVASDAPDNTSDITFDYIVIG